MPWEQPLQQILQSIEGPVAKIMAVIIIIVTGLTLAFGDTSGGFRRLVQIVFGLSIAFAASSFFLSFFSVGCPICNKLVVFLLGIGGAMTFFNPLRPFLGIASENNGGPIKLL